MNPLVELTERPVALETFMIAGWHQWADAGAISSGLPQYLIGHTTARKIGEIKPDGFYLFQIPGTHHLLRPKVKLEDGHPKRLSLRRNEFYYSGDRQRGLVLFVGEEPHQNVDEYVEAFLDVVEALGVKRVAAVGGVYGAMPYDRDREISCAYSLREMRKDLAHYAVKFSNYEGGSTIGTYLVDRAEDRGVEFVVFYGFVPAYDFVQLSVLLSGMRIENDYKAWYDLMRRLNYMFGTAIDLSDLEQRGGEIVTSMRSQIDELDKRLPQLEVRAYIDQLTEGFKEEPFMPLGDVWEQELRDLFGDAE